MPLFDTWAFEPRPCHRLEADGRPRAFPIPPPPSRPVGEEPDYCDEIGLWLYGNVGILRQPLAFIPGACGRADHSPSELDSIEREAEALIWDRKVIVTGIHSPAHQRAAIVPLRFGAPRIVAFSGGFHYHLGSNLDEEPFRTARLWRYVWDPGTDLAVSRRAPDRKPTFALYNPTVDRLIARIVRAQGQWNSLR